MMMMMMMKYNLYGAHTEICRGDISNSLTMADLKKMRDFTAEIVTYKCRHVHARSVCTEQLDEGSASQSCIFIYHSRRDSNSGRPAAKTGLPYLICDADNSIKMWSACARHEIQYKA